MNIKRLGEDLIIIPETDFEADWLRSKDPAIVNVFHKCGQSAADYIGLKLRFDNQKRPQ